MSASLEEQGTTENGPPTFGLAVVHCPRAPPSSHPCSPLTLTVGSREGGKRKKKGKKNQLQGTCKEGEFECKTSRKLSPCRRCRTKILTPLTDSFTSFTIITAHTSNLLYARREVC